MFISPRSDLLRLVAVILAAPSMLIIAGNGLAQQLDTNKCQNSSSANKISASESRRDLRRTLAVETRSLLSPDRILDLPDASSPSSDIEQSLQVFVATAYCIKNTTAAGIIARPGIIAADPKVVPLGSIVKIRAGKYSGTYHVMDTGPGIRGNRLDIYVSCRNEAISFGRRKVELEIVRYGWGDQRGKEEIVAGQ